MKPLVAVDYDDTWSSSPKLFKALGKRIRRKGGKVVVVTGNADAHAELKDLGAQGAFDDVVVIAHGPNDSAESIATNKRKWLKDNKADLLIDNNVANCIAATQVCDAALFMPQQKK